MALNPYEELITFLVDEWDEQNTSGFTPAFIRTVSQKTINFSQNPVWVMVGRMRKTTEEAGIGNTLKHVIFQGDLDVRVFGRNSEELYLEVTEEIERILDAKTKLFTDTDSEFHIIQNDGDRIELSGDTHDIFRCKQPVKLIKYSVQRGT